MQLKVGLLNCFQARPPTTNRLQIADFMLRYKRGSFRKPLQKYCFFPIYANFHAFCANFLSLSCFRHRPPPEEWHISRYALLQPDTPKEWHISRYALLQPDTPKEWHISRYALLQPDTPKGWHIGNRWSQTCGHCHSAYRQRPRRGRTSLLSQSASTGQARCQTPSAVSRIHL